MVTASLMPSTTTTTASPMIRSTQRQAQAGAKSAQAAEVAVQLIAQAALCRAQAAHFKLLAGLAMALVRQRAAAAPSLARPAAAGRLAGFQQAAPAAVHPVQVPAHADLANDGPFRDDLAGDASEEIHRLFQFPTLAAVA